MTHDLWQRYARIWSLDAADRAAEMAACLAPEVTYADPNVSLAGLDAFSQYMAGFQRSFPGHSFRIRAVRAHHGRSVARWDLVDGKGAVASPGISFAFCDDDGRFRSLHGFFGDVEELLR
jgi:hypothetical protein